SPIKPPRPLSTMTISEVLAFQDRAVAMGSESSAAGKYQFIRKTLRSLVKDFGIDPNTPFDARTQNYLARVMLASCGFYGTEKTNNEIGNCLSRVWAALPVMSGPKAGKSYYHGKAGNRALTTIDQVDRMITARSTVPEQ